MKRVAYSKLVEVYEQLSSTSKRIAKEEIVAEFLKSIKGSEEYIYLLRGKVLPDFDMREFGVSDKISIKAISFSLGVNEKKIYDNYRKVGDLGIIAEKFAEKKNQERLFKSKLTIDKVFGNLKKLVDIKGKGTVLKRINLIAEILGQANGLEAKYIIRTILGQLRVGVAEGIVRDGIALAVNGKRDKDFAETIEEVYDLSNDFAEVLEAAFKGKKELEKISIIPGRPLNVMLAAKAKDIEDAFRTCGKPAAIEHKYDGFRMLIHKNKEGFRLFTRRLEEVSNQFPDVIKIVENHINGKEYIVDCEVVGYDPKTKKYKPFEFISQRIKRKYKIEDLEKKLPVEVNAFDIVYLDGKSLMKEKFKNRRKILEKIVSPVKWKLRLAEQVITDSVKKTEEFYKKAIEKGDEGIMIKNLDSIYQQGRRVGHMVKLKPDVADLDLVIVGAEWGSGKRAGWLTSFHVACKKDEEFVEIGRVSSGLKEKASEGVSYEEITDLLKPLVVNEKGKYVSVKPKVVVSVTYQNVQKSPSYSSGYALRFPRIRHYRPDRSTRDIATLEEIKKEIKE